MKLVVEPGRRPIGDTDEVEFVGVPFGSYSRLILLYLQTQALRTNSREVELGRSWRARMAGLACLGVKAQARLSGSRQSLSAAAG
jgi:hypothetical protein